MPSEELAKYYPGDKTLWVNENWWKVFSEEQRIAILTRQAAHYILKTQDKDIVDQYTVENIKNGEVLIKIYEMLGDEDRANHCIACDFNIRRARKKEADEKAAAAAAEEELAVANAFDVTPVFVTQTSLKAT